MCPSPLFYGVERSRRASRRAALAVSALRRTSWCTACGARGDTTRRSRAGLATLARLDSVRREITIFRASFAACFAAVWAAIPYGKLLHAAVARISRKSPLYGVPRDGSRGAPARGAAGPRSRDGNERGLLPGFLDAATQRTRLAEASGPASRREWSFPRARSFHQSSGSELPFERSGALDITNAVAANA